MKIIKQKCDLQHLMALDYATQNSTYIVSKVSGLRDLIFRPMMTSTLFELKESIHRGELFLTIKDGQDDKGTEVIYNDTTDCA